MRDVDLSFNKLRICSSENKEGVYRHTIPQAEIDEKDRWNAAVCRGKAYEFSLLVRTPY